MRVIGVIALGLALSGASVAASGPAVRVTKLRPLTVHGWRFNSGEHLRIVVTTKRRTEHRLDASARGTFTLRLRGVAVGRCAQYSVRVFGPSGLRAGIKSPPQSCGAPPAPAP